MIADIGEEKPTEKSFRGFYSPRSTQVPDNFFDEVMPLLSGAETKVLLYVFRRTFGFKKDADNISLSQLVSGITTRDGRVLDSGTGLSKGTVTTAISKLVERGMLQKKRRRSQQRGDEATTYAPRLTFEQASSSVETSDPVYKNRTRGGVRKSDRPVSENRTHKKTVHSSTSKTVNGDSDGRSLLRRLPDLKQAEGQRKFTVEEILQQYGDRHSQRHYQLVASKVPYSVIHRAMSEIRNDGGANNPARVFTTRMERYAERQLQRPRESASRPASIVTAERFDRT